MLSRISRSAMSPLFREPNNLLMKCKLISASFRFGIFAVCALILIFVSACTTTEFIPWEGTEIESGRGGTKKVVNGIDVWQYGTPPRRYQVVGLVKDSRDPDAPFSSLLDDATQKAREAGADAIILVSTERHQTGSTTTPSVTEVKVKNTNTVTAVSSPETTSIDYEETNIFKAVKYLP